MCGPQISKFSLKLLPRCGEWSYFTGTMSGSFVTLQEAGWPILKRVLVFQNILFLLDFAILA